MRYHFCDITWALRCLKSPADLLFAQRLPEAKDIYIYAMYPIKKSSKHYGSFVRESTQVLHVDSPHKWTVFRKTFPFHEFIIVGAILTNHKYQQAPIQVGTIPRWPDVMMTSENCTTNCCLPTNHFKMNMAWWRHQMETFPRYWSFVRGIHRWPVNSPHKGKWSGALMFSLICAWTNGWVKHRDAGNLTRRPRRSLWCHGNGIPRHRHAL